MISLPHGKSKISKKYPATYSHIYFVQLYNGKETGSYDSWGGVGGGVSISTTTTTAVTTAAIIANNNQKNPDWFLNFLFIDFNNIN